jgi:hypothetical protein
MPKPLSLFIHAPFRPGDTPPGHWTRRLAYGDSLPADLQANRGELSEFVLLETTDPGAQIHAAATGYLSTRFPTDRVADLSETLTPDMSIVEPATLVVYLNPRPFLDLFPGFSARASQLTCPIPIATPGLLDRFSTPPGFLTGFIYLNIDTASIRASLQAPLDGLTVPPAATSMERDRRWRLFLAGEADIPVEAGQVIGRAGAPAIPPATAGNRQLGFAVLGRNGTLDPSRWYDWMRDFVEEEPTLDDWISLVPTRWPLLGGGLTVAQGIQRTADIIYPFSALLEFARDSNLSPAQWRQVGDNQKALYRRRLLQRTGQAPAGDSAPPFEFNDTDITNIFQLEAIVEFYKNFDDPWDILSTPKAPGDSGFTTVNLLPMQGTAAVPTGLELTFVNPPDFDQIWPARDLIFLEEDGARPTRTYRIMSIDAANDKVTLDAPPDLGVVASTAWHILSRPSLVLIDPMGGRLRGTNATVTATAPTVRVRLDVPAGGLAKINKHKFDTVYFYSDTRATFRPRTYGILEANSATNTIVLEAAPSFAGGSSSWSIPAGLGGQLPPMDYDLGASAARGWDHYDGLMFVVCDGEVRSRFRFTGITSHAPDPATDPQARSTIRGNTRYFCRGFRSGNDYRNFSFEVVDAGSMTFAPDGWTFGYDGVRENRFYFDQTVTEDTAPPGTDPSAGSGKTLVRIHRGNRTAVETGSGSEGCIVSPLYFELRSALIDIHFVEHTMVDPAPFDPRLDTIGAALTPAANTTAYGAIPASTWNDKIALFLWIIRPDERPLG